MSTEKQKAVFMCMPSHNGQIHYMAATSFFQRATQRHNTLQYLGNNSLLANNFNTFWCNALNARDKYDLKWFCMLHADINPEYWWLDKLIDIAESNYADLLSVVIPFKDASGLTSTAVAERGQQFGGMRLTLKQVHNILPETFSYAHIYEAHTKAKLPLFSNPVTLSDIVLLVNTGCMILRLDRDWSDELFFTINDRITRNYGVYSAETEPEDWFLSKLVAQHGGRVMATRAVKAVHLGGGTYTNEIPYGHDVDPNYPR